MVFAGGPRRLSGVLVGLLLLAPGLAIPAAAQQSAAETIADKFSNDAAAAQRRAEEQRKKDAEAKAMEALREQARKRAEDALKAERAKELKAHAGQTRPAQAAASPPAAVPAVAPADPKTEEQEMLARARQEEADRHKPAADAAPGRTIEQIIAERAAKADEAATAAARAKMITDARRTWQHSAQRIAATEKEIAEAQARAKIVADARRTWQHSAQRIAVAEKEVAEAQARAKIVANARRTWQHSAQRIAAAEKEVAEAQARAKIVADARRTWQHSAQRIAVAEKDVAEAQARAEAERKAMAAATTPALSAPPPKEAVAAAPASVHAPALPQRVTVLLIMQPGDKGIRRHNKSADPILCVNGGCYVSRGADAPAHFMPGRQALSLANTWGARAGACRNQLGCVFRGLAVEEIPLLVQPVDMRVIKHDRRHMAAISADSRCRLEAGRLACARGIVEDDYVMWVIPESLAETAGPALLEQTLNAGLTGPQSAHVEVRQ